MGKCIYANRVLNPSDAMYVPRRVKLLNYLGHKLECACCGTRKYLTFDHIKPLSKGGNDSNTNGQILCSSCNELKAARIISLQDLKKEVN